MKTNLISLRTSRLSYSAFKELVASVISGMTGSTYYSTPTPSLIEMGSLLTTYSDALTAWLSDGGNVEFTTLQEAKAALEEGLKTLQAYCVSQTPGNLLAFQSVNWPTVKPSSPVGVLGAVTKLRQLFQESVIQGWVKLKWNRPNDTVGVKIPMFIVMRSSTNDFSAAVEMGRVTRMEFIDKTVGMDTFFYWVIPVNAYGDGAVSAVCVARSNQLTA